MVVVLAGGTGGAKLARGMLDVVGERARRGGQHRPTTSRSTARTSRPTPTSCAFWLADRIDERGWGLRGDTLPRDGRSCASSASTSGSTSATATSRSACAARGACAEGATLTEAIAELARGARACGARVLPMADEPVRTRVLRPRALAAFQEFMIRERGEGPVDGVELRGHRGGARRRAAVLEAIAGARAIVLGPSNPVISIRPILAVPGMSDALRAAAAPVVAVSPVVGGAGAQGPDRGVHGVGRAAA